MKRILTFNYTTFTAPRNADEFFFHPKDVTRCKHDNLSRLTFIISVKIEILERKEREGERKREEEKIVYYFADLIKMDDYYCPEREIIMITSIKYIARE